jgi:HK97 family phage prohead protease
MNIERRLSISVRAEGTERAPVLIGHAAVFNSLSKRIYTKAGSYFHERIAPGAFRNSIAKGATVANIGHDMQRPLATQRAGTLHLSEDSRGLAVRCEINPNVTYAADAWHNARSQNLSTMSFAFSLGADADQRGRDVWEELDDNDLDELDIEDEGGYRAARRTILDVDTLQDVAFLTEGTGAYDEADCYADLRMSFPAGVPAGVEARSNGGIVLPSIKVSDSERARRRMTRLRSAL